MNNNRDLFTGNVTAEPELNAHGKAPQLLVHRQLTTNLTLPSAVSGSKIIIQVDVNIWGNPAENFAMLAKRGQEIFVEASLRQEKQEESVLKVSRLLAVLPTLGRPWTAKVLAEALVGAAKAATRSKCCRVWWLID